MSHTLQTRTYHRLATISAAVILILATATTARAVITERNDAGRHYLGGTGWPKHGQAAYVLADGHASTSPDERQAPIASLAKVMTAYLVLHAYPLQPGQNGFVLGITQDDVKDTANRRSQQQSTVRVEAGEHLTERQALAALLLPSANNIAVILARIVAGSVPSFVSMMNASALALGMHHTSYTDPSGFDAGTRSTAADQLVLARAAMADPTFAAIVALHSYPLPVAGTVHNTDTLLGKDGFAGIKTGSMDASGGCFMFLSYRVIDGKKVALYGVVMGQPGHNLITAALTAARQLADNVAPAVG